MNHHKSFWSHEHHVNHVNHVHFGHFWAFLGILVQVKCQVTCSLVCSFATFVRYADPGTAGEPACTAELHLHLGGPSSCTQHGNPNAIHFTGACWELRIGQRTVGKVFGKYIDSPCWSFLIYISIHFYTFLYISLHFYTFLYITHFWVVHQLQMA